MRTITVSDTVARYIDLVKDAVKQYNDAILDCKTEYAYLSETWATFPNRG